MKSTTTPINQLSHQLRTPLMGILGCAQILQHDSLTSPQSRHVSGILQAGQQILQCIKMIEQLNIKKNVKKKVTNEIKNSQESNWMKANSDRSILLIEDNQVIQGFYEMAFKNLGYTVHIVSSAEEAVAFFNNNLAAIITDIGLQGKSGIDLAKEYRRFEKINKTSRIPIIAITAYTDTVIHKKCMKAGINEVVTKPVLQEQLKTVLNQWINLSQIKNI